MSGRVGIGVGVGVGVVGCGTISRTCPGAGRCAGPVLDLLARNRAALARLDEAVAA